jgi:starch phosphorylase
MRIMSNGHADLARAADALASQLPGPLAPLARLAYNYRWSWAPGGTDLFRSVDPLRWEKCGGNPVRLLQEASHESLARTAADGALLDRFRALELTVREDLERDAEETGDASADRPAAYFSAEFGVHASLPIYSGGLGALAGDILKEASDLAIPLVAVGLMYRQGYFRQRIDGWGWQHEYWVDTDPDRVPAALVRGEDDAPLTVTVPIRGVDVVAQIWRVDVGRVPLYLLDAERPENDQITRWITSRLYVGDPDTRLAQYILLGVGGMRALRTLGIDPGLVHLNEGHAAFAALELARQEAEGGLDIDSAFDAARGRTVFTTHTPVPAGNDTYQAGQVSEAVRGLTDSLGAGADVVIRRGRTNPDDSGEPFGVTQFALRTSRAANAVSRRHGEVAREMWQLLWPGRPVEEVPIGHVTNGVHVPTWIGGPMRELLDRHLGDGWMAGAGDRDSWSGVDSIPDEELWAVRERQRADLVEYVRHKSVADRLARSEPLGYVEAAARSFHPEILTIGFARRLATYKRLNLLAQSIGDALDLLDGKTGIQLVIAGKAHPRDDDGKRLVQGLFANKNEPLAHARIVFLDDYDLTMAARLVQGCDVWLNLPRPPLEASGTSGMKSAVNGGLQLSVLDGWWAEAYDGSNGWALSGEVDHDHGAQDHRHKEELFRLLRGEVLREFHARDDGGIPRAWVARVKASLRTNGPEFAAGRMLRDYAERMYAAERATR